MEIKLLSATPNAQEIALTAIRTCYSPNKPSEIIALEGHKYFGREAKDGQGGTDADRLIRHIVNSGHTSTLEHIHFVFSVEGVSRSLLAQLTRHRHLSYSVQSQRYVKLESDSRSGGFDYVAPPSLDNDYQLKVSYERFMEEVQRMYDAMRISGISAEDARYILPNATECNLVLSGNLRSFLEFYGKRNENTHAQWEIQEFAEQIKQQIVDKEPWLQTFFLPKGEV